MSTETKTNLRQSKTKIQVEGILATKDLEEVTDKNGNKGIRGSLSIKVDDLNTIRFKVYVGEKKSNGDHNPTWDGIATVMKEYKSIADVGVENADRVRVSNGTFNTYKNQNGQDVTTYQSNFFNRVERELVPERYYSAECFIKAKSWEVDSEGNETGRLKLRCISPNYNGIDILDMVVPKETEDNSSFAVDADNLFEIGTTFQIDGQIVNSRVEKKGKAALGTIKSDVEYKNELVVTGCSPQYEDELAYDADSINLAIQEYENTQASRRAESEKKPASKPSAAASGRAGLSF